jgi:dTDP-4-amino-4,6-dideoxygalactose transaminase
MNLKLKNYLKMNIIDYLKKEKLRKINKELPIGQLYFPNSKAYESIFKKLFKSNSYTNHGIYLEEFESKLEKFCGVNNAVCVTNATIGLIMLLEALEISGEIILPNFSFIATLQSVKWANIKPKFIDVDFQTHHLDIDTLESSINNKTKGILNVNLWGGYSNIEKLNNIVKKYDLKLAHDSAQSFGSNSDCESIFDHPHVFSFHATKILSSGEGGCIVTNDNNLADVLRNIRSSYGVRTSKSVYRTSNGRMSEAQAAIGLYNLNNISKYKKNNKSQFKLYKRHLNQKFIEIYDPKFTSDSNFQYLTCVINDNAPFTRNKLINILNLYGIYPRTYFAYSLSENYPLYINRKDKYPNTKKLNEKILQLPIGSNINKEDILNITNVINSFTKFYI